MGDPKFTLEDEYLSKTGRNPPVRGVEKTVMRSKAKTPIT